MDGSSTDVCCSNATFGICSSQLHCSANLVAQFHKSTNEEVWHVNALLLVNAILAGVIVGIGAYGHRYRYHGFTRYLFLGATTLFLSIISVLLSAKSSTHGEFNIAFGEFLDRETLTAQCRTIAPYPYMVILCACFVPISAINTSAIVAGDDREARDITPPFELLIQGIWTFYLAVTNKTLNGFVERGRERDLTWLSSTIRANNFFYYFQYTPFAIIYAKMAHRYYAFERARRSFALGHNPRLIVGYMQQLREGSQHGEPLIGEEIPPPLVVMGEEGRQVEKQPHGYLFSNTDGLVTIDTVWQSDNMLLVSMPQLKDICMSFALFKLLRCRFARYKPTDAISMETLNFFRSVLLKDGKHERAFGMIADELSFLHDYYYTSLPISYSTCWLPMLSISISLLSIGFCILAGKGIMSEMQLENSQMTCLYSCTIGYLRTDHSDDYGLGSLYFGFMPAVLLSALVMLSEARDIASYICSNWTKVALTCCSINHASLQKKWVRLLLRCRCKLMKHWNGKMSQCSLLVLHPRKAPLVLLRHLLRLPDQKMKNVKVPTAVKVCIINALRSSCSGGLSKGTTSLHQSQIGESFLWACNSKGTSDTILIWHIATCILEVRHPDQHDLQQRSPICDHKIIATHLSRYCAYLVAYSPELLPDDDAWSKSLYKAVKKDVDRVLASDIGVFAPEAEYERLVKLLSTRGDHEVLKDGAKLGEQLAELIEGQETAWKVLAGFWSEMILYVAPSDNINGHAEAIARGGELITLLWALLTHVGIVERPNATASAPFVG